MERDTLFLDESQYGQDVSYPQIDYRLNETVVKVLSSLFFFGRIWRADSKMYI